MSGQPHRDGGGLPEPVVLAEHGGVRTFYVWGKSVRDLAERLSITIAEHGTDSDELHISYAAVQSGWQQHPGRDGAPWRQPQPPYTELFFEYSAIVVMRPRGAPPPAG